MFSAPVRAEVEPARRPRARYHQPGGCGDRPHSRAKTRGLIRLPRHGRSDRKGKTTGDPSFRKEDRKIRIEVGYGLEHRLTDLICGRIIRNHIVPNFKAGRFDDGLRTGVAAILEILNGTDDVGAAGETSAEPAKDFAKYTNSVLHYLVAAILMGISVAFFAGVLYALFSMAFFQTVSGWADSPSSRLYFPVDPAAGDIRARIRRVRRRMFHRGGIRHRSAAYRHENLFPARARRKAHRRKIPHGSVQHLRRRIVLQFLIVMELFRFLVERIVLLQRRRRQFRWRRRLGFVVRGQRMSGAIVPGGGTCHRNVRLVCRTCQVSITIHSTLRSRSKAFTARCARS